MHLLFIVIPLKFEYFTINIVLSHRSKHSFNNTADHVRETLFHIPI